MCFVTVSVPVAWSEFHSPSCSQPLVGLSPILASSSAWAASLYVSPHSSWPRFAASASATDSKLAGMCSLASSVCGREDEEKSHLPSSISILTSLGSYSNSVAFMLSNMVNCVVVSQHGARNIYILICHCFIGLPLFRIYRAVSIHKYNLEMSLNLTCVGVKHTVSLYYQLSTLVVTLVAWNKHLVCENHHVASSYHKFGASNSFLCFFVREDLDVCCWGFYVWCESYPFVVKQLNFCLLKSQVP